MSRLTGTGALIRLILRRDRIRLPVWLISILGLASFASRAVTQTYDTPEDIAAYADTVASSPAVVAMSGPATAVDTLAGVVIFEINITMIVATALMAIFLAVRHTRTEEEHGRTELIRATVVGRYAPVAAALIVVAAASVVVGTGLALILISLDLPVGGSLVYGASLAGLGIVFTAVGATAAQVTEHARGALGLAGAFLGVSYAVRAAGDVGDGTLSWFSPIGWMQAVHPYDDDRWWPLLLSLAFTLVLLATVRALTSHRDVGSGLVAPRPGPAAASPRLTTAVGLAVRLQRGAIVGWASGLFLGGIAYGSIGKEVEGLIEEIPELEDAFNLGGAADIVDAFFATAILVLALTAAGFTVSSVLRLRSEEGAGRAEPLLATGLSRLHWTLASLLVTFTGTVLVVGAAGFGAGLAHAIATGDASQLPRLLGAALIYTPAALVLAGFAVLLFGWFPRQTAAVWGLLAMSFVFGWLGGVLDVPGWLNNLSPFSHVPGAPQEAVTAGPLLALAAVAVAMTVAGLAGFRRRDLGTS